MAQVYEPASRPSKSAYEIEYEDEAEEDVVGGHGRVRSAWTRVMRGAPSPVPRRERRARARDRM
jgi:hypothetical protein